MPDRITSAANQHIKNVLKLQSSSRERKEQNLFVIEGYREIVRAMESGIQIKELYCCAEIDKQNHAKEILLRNETIKTVEVSSEVFSRLAYRESSDGLIALAEPRQLSLNDINLKANPFILVLEAVEKPGNLGAIMRTADAAAIDAVIICDPLTDIYNPNAIRSAVGCMFSRPLVACTSHEALGWLQKNKIKSFAAALTAEAEVYTQHDFRDATALVLGAEATGLSKLWLENSYKQVIIPMLGIADSLNVSVSAAVLVFEALRQRNA